MGTNSSWSVRILKCAAVLRTFYIHKILSQNFVGVTSIQKIGKVFIEALQSATLP